MTVNQVINHCLDLDFYQLQDFAGENYKQVYYHIKSTHGGEKANTLLIGSIFTCVAADGSLSENEWNFIAQFVGGYSRQEAFDVAGEFYNREAQEVVTSLAAHFPAQIREAFICLCIAVLTVDKRVYGEEVSLLENILDA